MSTISGLKIGECTIVSDYLMREINCKVDLKDVPIEITTNY